MPRPVVVLVVVVMVHSMYQPTRCGCHDGLFGEWRNEIVGKKNVKQIEQTQRDLTRWFWSPAVCVCGDVLAHKKEQPIS